MLKISARNLWEKCYNVVFLFNSWETARGVIIDLNVGPTIMVYFSFISLHVWAVAGWTDKLASSLALSLSLNNSNPNEAVCEYLVKQIAPFVCVCERESEIVCALLLDVFQVSTKYSSHHPLPPPSHPHPSPLYNKENPQNTQVTSICQTHAPLLRYSPFGIFKNFWLSYIISWVSL
jgi:hypothetical protein